MASESKSDFLRFSAYSMKDLITRKLTEDKNFSDQVYEGSNLAILIDIMSYIFQGLVYQLNSAAAESMFADTQLYENIVRLCKFIGYTPKGAQPSIMSFSAEKWEYSGDTVEVPQYSYIDAGKADQDGKSITYALKEPLKLTRGGANTAILYNGKWQKYPTVLTATGVENEVFQLNLGKDEVAWPFIDVYRPGDDGKPELCKAEVGSTFTYTSDENRLKIYDKDSNDCKYRITIDENGKYGLEFGIGKRLGKNDALSVYYLSINKGVRHGDFEIGSVSGAKFKYDFEGDFPDAYDSSDDLESALDSVTFMNSSMPSDGTEAEGVEEIRQNAPMVNKIQHRLVTKYDYENFIKYMNSSNIIDVVAQNNYEYMNTFYKWLYMLGLEKHKDSAYYLNEDRLSKYDYRFSDAADQNTVYLWIKTFNNADIYFQTLNDQIEDLKMITTEVSYIEPVDVNFALCGSDDAIALASISTNGTVDGNSYLEVTLNENCVYSSAQLTRLIEQKITDFFEESKQRIGGKIAIGDLTNDVYSIGGIQQLKTVYSNGDSKFTRYGINFACWSASVIDAGDDLFFVNGDKTLETFQFPVLDPDMRIKIIKRHNESIMESINY